MLLNRINSNYIIELITIIIQILDVAMPKIYLPKIYLAKSYPIIIVSYIYSSR